MILLRLLGFPGTFGKTVPFLLGLAVSVVAFGNTEENAWSVGVAAGYKISFDSNLFQQDIGDQAKRETWVNTFSASVALSSQSNPQFKSHISYAADASFYDGQSVENHVIHRAGFRFNGESGNTQWEWLSGVTRIVGDKQGPRYTLNGGTSAAELPVIGGVPIRDRRDAAIFRSSFKLTQNFGTLFLRPVATFYHHNFMTEQHAPIGAFLGYENYVDRREIGGGCDIGFEAFDNNWLVAGVRYGRQKQYQLLGASSSYGNHYVRLLFGIEGRPAAWLKLNVLAGPDFRNFGSSTPAGFDSNKVYTFIDANAVITLTEADSLTVAIKRFMQPSYTSLSLYEDIVYEFNYVRILDQRFTAGAGFKAYNAKWRPPAQRDDWVFTPGIFLSYTHNANVSAELTYTHEWSDSKIANTEGREFTRHLVGLGLKYRF